MNIGVGIDTARHWARALYDGHRHPFCSNGFKGWHARPGKETVTSRCVYSDLDTLRNGACPSQLAARPTRTPRTSARNESDRSTNHAERSGHQQSDGGPHALAPTHTHWALCVPFVAPM